MKNTSGNTGRNRNRNGDRLARRHHDVEGFTCAEGRIVHALFMSLTKL
ncbi:MAG: hypothetical protein BWY42_01442 [Candidatus Omnitrophica bacterium ADurb.Bin277]|nr:MAG: hypothetical protein BWY42_01442 [Candidatus Omnitrophica bacterium ADurb.Bin277]